MCINLRVVIACLIDKIHLCHLICVQIVPPSCSGAHTGHLGLSLCIARAFMPLAVFPPPSRQWHTCTLS